MPGPVPKRSTERRRRNKPETPILKAEGAEKVEWPPASTEWHPIAREMYLSLQVSGQSRFYEPSDVQFAVYAAEITSRSLGARLNGNVIGVVIDLWSALLTTEADRRRLRIELERKAPEAPPSVLILDKYRSAIT